jgi:hypothetical protein
MTRARKLFPSYGSALAANLLAKLERDHVVQHFVSSYVAQYDRRGILGGPSRDRELADTIGREAVLAMIYEVRQSMPRFFGRKRAAALPDTEKEAVEAFFRELIETLARAWHWTAEDRREFRRDLTMYSEFAPRQGKAATKDRSRQLREEDPPFIGRVALLLDPSMLDQARRAARKFFVEVGLLAQKVLKQTLRPGR